MSRYLLEPPGDEEMAAVAVAAELLWPRLRPGGDLRDAPATAWRFSGRWWAKPEVARRERPWRW